MKRGLKGAFCPATAWLIVVIEESSPMKRGLKVHNEKANVRRRYH